MFLVAAFTVISTIVVICIATPIFIIVVLPIGFLYFGIQVSV